MHFLQAINSDLSVLIVCNKTGGTTKGDKKKFHKGFGGGVRAGILFQTRTDLLHCLYVYDTTPHHTSNGSTNIKQVSTKYRTEATDFSHNKLQELHYKYTH